MIDHRVNLYGGVNEKLPSLSAPENYLLIGINVECKKNGVGLRRIDGYVKWDANEVTDATYIGAGRIRGVHRFNGAVYACRNTSNDSKLAIYKSTGSGWTVVKSGLEPDGTFEFRTYAFGGTEKLYGVDGVNPPFSLDSADAYTAIAAWPSANTPAHIEMHRNRMWLSKGAEIRYSDVGDPTSFLDYAALAGSIYAKATVTALSSLVGGTIAAFSRNTIAFLSGTGSESTLSAEFLVDHGNSIGARLGTVQTMGGRTFFLDDAGIMELTQAQEYGNFADGTVSDNVFRTVEKSLGLETISCVLRGKNQYRLFYNNGTGIILSLAGRKVIGLTTINWPDVVRCVHSTEDASGDELVVFGSDDGYIYQMDSGNSFDDENLAASLTTAYSPCKRPRNVKRFRRAIFDMRSEAETSIFAKALPKFDASEAQDGTEVALGGGLAILGQAVLGEAILGGTLIQEGRLDLPAIGDYIAMRIYSDSSTDPAWEIDGISYEFLEGRRRR